MEWISLLYAGIYLLIGWLLSDYLEKDDDVMGLVVFIAWPAVLVILIAYLLVALAYRIRDAFDDVFWRDM